MVKRFNPNQSQHHHARCTQRNSIIDFQNQGFDAIAVAEKQHEKRYLDLAKNIDQGTVFKKDKPVVWRCLNCGYVHEGAEASAHYQGKLRWESQ